MAYASVAERMLTAIGEPELVDTRLDPGCRASSPTR
jgi:serine protein kinase